MNITNRENGWKTLKVENLADLEPGDNSWSKFPEDEQLSIIRENFAFHNEIFEKIDRKSHLFLYLVCVLLALFEKNLLKGSALAFFSYNVIYGLLKGLNGYYPKPYMEADHAKFISFKHNTKYLRDENDVPSTKEARIKEVFDHYQGKHAYVYPFAHGAMVPFLICLFIISTSKFLFRKFTGKNLYDKNTKVFTQSRKKKFNKKKKDK